MSTWFYFKKTDWIENKQCSTRMYHVSKILKMSIHNTYGSLAILLYSPPLPNMFIFSLLNCGSQIQESLSECKSGLTAIQIGSVCTKSLFLTTFFWDRINTHCTTQPLKGKTQFFHIHTDLCNHQQSILEHFNNLQKNTVAYPVSTHFASY